MTQKTRVQSQYALIGGLLIFLFAMQAMLNLQWRWLAEIQKIESYRQVTGYLLFIYFGLQLRLGFVRARKRTVGLRREFDLHKWQGMFGPVLFYIHSIHIGYAYQALLTAAFLGNCLIGYLGPHTLPWRHKWYLSGWVMAHVCLAMLALGLMLLHMKIVYQFS